jgi:hypothetical protein
MIPESSKRSSRKDLRANSNRRSQERDIRKSLEDFSAINNEPIIQIQKAGRNSSE